MNRKTADDYLQRQINKNKKSLYLPLQSASIDEDRITDEYTQKRIIAGLPIMVEGNKLNDDWENSVILHMSSNESGMFTYSAVLGDTNVTGGIGLVTIRIDETNDFAISNIITKLVE